MFGMRPSFVAVAILVSAASAAFAQKPPEEELKALQVPDDVRIELFASEPMITNPAAIDVDTHGRVWVAEIEYYRRAAKNPPADRIKVLEDTDGDGRADKATLFADDLFAPMSICVAGTKVYVATSPDLWVYDDADGDLKADGPPKKLLTGFGGFNHDHGAHSLVLGPDHKWWMAHGDAGYDVTGTDGSKIAFPAGGMIRGELDGSKLENVAVNFRNPYEICVSSFGEAFCSDNDNDGNFSVRICWILEGGDYGWFKRPGPKFPPGTPYGETWHFRGALPGFVPGTLVTGFGSPCGMCFYEGDAFPKLKNVPLHCDAGPREVRAYPHEKSGAGFKAAKSNLVTSKGDDYFRPDDICTMPDGSLLVADWYDGGVGGHAYNNPGQGRIFRLTPKDRELKRREKPGPYASLDDATVGLHSPNLATQFLARERLLAGGEESVPKLIHQFENSDDNARARSLWLLDRIGGAGRAFVVKQLDSKEPAFRALAVRILRRRADDAVRKALLAAFDGGDAGGVDGETARELLLFYRSLPAELAAEVERRVTALALRYDGSDRYLLETLKLAAAGWEAKLADKVREAQQAQSAAKPSFEQRLGLGLGLDAPRFIDEVAHDFRAAAETEAQRLRLLDGLGAQLDRHAYHTVAVVAKDAACSPALRSRALEWLTMNCAPTGLWSGLVGPADAALVGIEERREPNPGYRGRPHVVACAKELLADPQYQAAALNLALAAKLAELGPEIVALVKSERTAAAVRGQAVQVLVATRPAGTTEALEHLLAGDDAKLRDLATVALVDTAQWNTVKKLVAPGGDTKQADAVIGRMMATTGGALVLLKWVDANELDAAGRKIAVDRAVRHPDANVRSLFEKFIPEDQRPQRLGAAIKADDILKLAGDPVRGEQIFNQSSAAQCKNCHAVRGFGKRLGPDLTTIGKKYERAALLETILDPSKAIAHEYVTYIVETDDGQSYTGFVEKNEKFVTVRTADDKQVRIPAKSVETLAPSPKSMMPELVLRDVTAQDAADLLAYLTTLKEPLPAK